MNETIFSDEERKALLNIFEMNLEEFSVVKEDMTDFDKALYMKLGGDMSEREEK